MKKFIIILFIFCNVSFVLQAQQSHIYSHKERDFQHALQRYVNQQYQSAQEMFSSIQSKTDDLDTQSDCAYYIASCAIRLQQFGADALMEEFVTQYPESAKRNTAFIDVANYYFEQGKYTKALDWYTEAETRNMASENDDMFYYRKGYTLFTIKRYEDAEPYFKKVSNVEKYTSEATYYLGYIAYNANDYEKANNYFNSIMNDIKFNKKLLYYQADMNFKLGNFQKAIDFGTKQLAMANRKEASQLHKIIGESHFNLQQYKEALPYLKQYKGQRGKWTHTDFYQLGYVYYKQADYENAIGQFNKIINGRDTIAQNAYYHLAECYLKTDKKSEALNAFKNASQMSFNSRIQEDASLNYARLSYDIGNPYQPVSEVLITYLRQYPDSGYTEEIKSLLLDAYLTAENYDEALAFLEQENTESAKATSQRVAFHYGLELYKGQKYNDAIIYLKRSLEQSRDAMLHTRALYWIAESNYMLDDYNSAAIDFKDFIKRKNAKQSPEYQTVDYHLGYTYFKQKAYDQAIGYFNTYVKNHKENTEKLNDSYLRMADAYFVKGNYKQAIVHYDNALNTRGDDKDYAYLQKAMSYGFSNQKEKKTEVLNTFLNSIPKSTLRDDAMYELGNTYIAINRVASGIQAYKQLAEDYKMSSFLPKALLKEGLIHYNAGKNDRALQLFKRVVKDYPKTQEAFQAIKTAKLIYIDINRVDEYAAWVNNLDFVEVPNAELDNAAFEAAEKQFIQNNTDAAIQGFESYIRRFSDGLHALKANFYLSQSYFKKGDKTKAIPYYSYIIQQQENEYTEQALARLGQIFMENKSYGKALPILKKLEVEAQQSQNVTFAQSNLMKAYYELKNYTETISYGKKVLSKTKIDNRIKSDAHIMVARAAIQTQNEDLAKTAYAQVLKIAQGALGAEALYYDAYFKHKAKTYKSSNNAIQKLAGKYPEYKEFGAKALLIMAKNFRAMKDAFQATYILENIMTNFTDYPEVVSEAKTILAEIKTEEARRNASIENGEN